MTCWDAAVAHFGHTKCRQGEAAYLMRLILLLAEFVKSREDATFSLASD